MAVSKQPVSKWFDGSTPLEELPETHQLAHEIVVGRGDLTSSVTRIMDAQLSDAGRTQALNAFYTSLSDLGDPNRDPRVSIAAAEGV
jgi:hypothetical protein